MSISRVRSHKDLIVWQKAVAFALSIHAATARFPRSEVFGITSQLRRAAVSVASNIAEGSARSSTREFMQFLRIARGSLAEGQTQLVLSHQAGYLSATEFERLDHDVDELGRLLNAVHSGLAKRLAVRDQRGARPQE